MSLTPQPVLAAPPLPTPTTVVLSTAQFAHRWNRSLRTIQDWCMDGTLIDFGFSTIQDGKGRWWIIVPRL